MTSISQDIKIAQKTINSNQKHVDRFQRIYPFATENIPGCFSFYDFNDKDCLTVLGSSSQMLYMYSNGAKSVTTFDINKLTLYHFYFIKAFLLSKLNKENLTQLYIDDRKSNTKIFDIISRYLEGDAKTFWNTLFENNGPSLFYDLRLFNSVSESSTGIHKTSGYLNDEELKRLRKNVDRIEPNFINCNIKDLEGNLDRKYDLMYLSNIIQYVEHKSLFGGAPISIPNEDKGMERKEKPLREYKKLLMSLSTHLKENGSLIGGYIYELDDYCSRIPIFDKPCREKVFNTKEFYYHLFDSFSFFQQENLGSFGTKDACLIYRR